MFRNLIHIAFLMIALPVIITTNIKAQEQGSEKLNIYIEAKKIPAKDFSSILSKIAFIYKVPIGFESQNIFQNNEKQQINSGIKNEDFVNKIKDGALREVLNELIRLNPSYVWDIQNGVINVFPKNNKDKVLQEILNTKISQITIDTKLGAMSFGDSIAGTSEIKNKLSPLSITDIHFYNSNEVITSIIEDRLNRQGIDDIYFDSSEKSSKNNKDDLSPLLKYEGKTVREILNSILKDSTYNFWTIVRWGDRGEFLTIVVS